MKNKSLHRGDAEARRETGTYRGTTRMSANRKIKKATTDDTDLNAKSRERSSLEDIQVVG
jgi:hypothetical protein